MGIAFPAVHTSGSSRCWKSMQPSPEIYWIWLCGKSRTFLSFWFLPYADSVLLLCIWEVWWVLEVSEHFPCAFSGSPLEEKHDQCKCENLIMFQNLANEEVRKLTQRYILF